MSTDSRTTQGSRIQSSCVTIFKCPNNHENNMSFLCLDDLEYEVFPGGPSTSQRAMLIVDPKVNVRKACALCSTWEPEIDDFGLLSLLGGAMEDSEQLQDVINKTISDIGTFTLILQRPGGMGERIANVTRGLLECSATVFCARGSGVSPNLADRAITMVIVLRIAALYVSAPECAITFNYKRFIEKKLNTWTEELQDVLKVTVTLGRLMDAEDESPSAALTMASEPLSGEHLPAPQDWNMLPPHSSQDDVVMGSQDSWGVPWREGSGNLSPRPSRRLERRAPRDGDGPGDTVPGFSSESAVATVGSLNSGLAFSAWRRREADFDSAVTGSVGAWQSSLDVPSEEPASSSWEWSPPPSVPSADLAPPPSKVPRTELSPEFLEPEGPMHGPFTGPVEPWRPLGSSVEVLNEPQLESEADDGGSVTVYNDETGLNAVLLGLPTLRQRRSQEDESGTATELSDTLS